MEIGLFACTEIDYLTNGGSFFCVRLGGKTGFVCVSLFSVREQAFLLSGEAAGYGLERQPG